MCEEPNTLPRKLFGEFLECVHATFEGKGGLKDKANRKLWNPINNSKNEEHDKEERDAGKRS